MIIFFLIYYKSLALPLTLLKMGCFRTAVSGILMSTPQRVFLKLPFEGVTGHPQNTVTSASESLKEVICKYFHISFSSLNSINSQVYVIESFF